MHTRLCITFALLCFVAFVVMESAHSKVVVQASTRQHIEALSFNKQQLVQVQVISRHGDRTSRAQLPNNPVVWPEGEGQLTGEGMRQTNQLGKLLHKRYSGKLLNQSYVAKEAYFRSSDIDRTLMSAECILLGVYPPGTGPFVKNQPALPFGIQPVPIHTIPRPDEIYLLGENYCPTYNQRLQKEHQTKEWQTLFKNNAEFLTYLSKMTGASVSLPKFYDIYDALYVLSVHHKLTLNISEETLQRVEDLANTVESINHRWDVLGNLGASPLINETLYHMNKVISGDADAKKYIHWSGHDVTLMSVASAYQLDRYYSKFNIIPTYASAFALELYQEDDGENPTYSVRLLFKLGNETDFTPYVIPGCSDTICNMDLYTKAVKTNAIVGDSIRDWCKECGNYFAEACRSNDSRSWASSTPPQIGVLGSFRE